MKPNEELAAFGASSTAIGLTAQTPLFSTVSTVITSAAGPSKGVALAKLGMTGLAALGPGAIFLGLGCLGVAGIIYLCKN